MPTRIVTLTPERRVPNQRGLQTRQKLLDATIELLATRPYRDIKVMDIAHVVGTSPATFYQYFANIEGVVLEASGFLAEESNAALGDFKDGSWSSDGMSGATRLVDAVLDGWSGHLPVMRVLTAVAAERDPRFVKAYAEATRPVIRALTAATTNGTGKGLVHALVSCLTAAAGHDSVGKVQGLTKHQRRQGLALLVHAAVSSTAA
ncbi:TetR/AcrR family transcriptional regulator [Streptomyces albidoflavus]|uniref:TetR/AcrR family transcriptional regulator n=1 Tax=Streptomyces albidoflavus TaxID=1886 RepID=UPI00343963A0